MRYTSVCFQYITTSRKNIDDKLTQVVSEYNMKKLSVVYTIKTVSVHAFNDTEWEDRPGRNNVVMLIC